MVGDHIPAQASGDHNGVQVHIGTQGEAHDVLANIPVADLVLICHSDMAVAENIFGAQQVGIDHPTQDRNPVMGFDLQLQRDIQKVGSAGE